MTQNPTLARRKLHVMTAHEAQSLQSDRLVPAAEVAALLGVSYSTVQRMGTRGELTPIRLSPRCTRYRLSDVDALIGRTTGTEHGR